MLFEPPSIGRPLTLHACAVCVLLREDYTPKRTLWCGLCGEEICDDCRPQLDDRIVAAGITIREALKAGFRRLADLLAGAVR